MRLKIVNLAVILLMMFALATMGYGQGTQTGSISGTVVDTEGSPLPGCTVTLTGEKLLGERSFVTTETGKFRFPSLSPGSGYTVKVVISGFNTTVRPGLVVNVGRTVDITIDMQLQTVEEEITVTAESPVVDVETSKISVNSSVSPSFNGGSMPNIIR